MRDFFFGDCSGLSFEGGEDVELQPRQATRSIQRITPLSGERLRSRGLEEFIEERGISVPAVRLGVEFRSEELVIIVYSARELQHLFKLLEMGPNFGIGERLDGLIGVQRE